MYVCTFKTYISFITMLLACSCGGVGLAFLPFLYVSVSLSAPPHVQACSNISISIPISFQIFMTGRDVNKSVFFSKLPTPTNLATSPLRKISIVSNFFSLFVTTRINYCQNVLTLHR